LILYFCFKLFIVFSASILAWKTWQRTYIAYILVHSGTAHPQLADTEGYNLWKVIVNIMNEQSKQVDKGWSYSLGVWEGKLTLPHRKK
jgi:hypothetical protein